MLRRKVDTDTRIVMDALRRLVRGLRLTARTAEKDLGISGAQLFALGQLALAPGSSLQELAERTLTDQSSVSVLVSRLHRRRLVSRRTSSRDHRRLELTVTTAGRRLLARAPEPQQVSLVTALRRLPPTKRRTLATALGALVREMGLHESPATLFFEEGPRR